MATAPQPESQVCHNVLEGLARQALAEDRKRELALQENRSAETAERKTRLKDRLYQEFNDTFPGIRTGGAIIFDDDNRAHVEINRRGDIAELYRYCSDWSLFFASDGEDAKASVIRSQDELLVALGRRLEEISAQRQEQEDSVANERAEITCGSGREESDDRPLYVVRQIMGAAGLAVLLGAITRDGYRTQYVFPDQDNRFGFIVVAVLEGAR